MGIIVGRPINGVTINGLEYLCDNDGRAIVFEDEQDARQFLQENGIHEDDIDAQGIEFVEDKEDE